MSRIQYDISLFQKPHNLCIPIKLYNPVEQSCPQFRQPDYDYQTRDPDRPLCSYTSHSKTSCEAPSNGPIPFKPLRIINKDCPRKHITYKKSQSYTVRSKYLQKYSTSRHIVKLVCATKQNLPKSHAAHIYPEKANNKILQIHKKCYNYYAKSLDHRSTTDMVHCIDLAFPR